MKRFWLRWGLLGIGLSVLAGGAGEGEAAQISSQYEKVKFYECEEKEKGDTWIVRRCTMEKGPAIWFGHHEHGLVARLEPGVGNGAYQSDSDNFKPARSGHFGDPILDGEERLTVEWRVKMQDGQWVPFAAIFRTGWADFSGSDGNGKPRQRLQGIKFGEGHACEAVTVEASVPDHNAVMREKMDALVDVNPCPDVE